jgi:hypothetical protein
MEPLGAPMYWATLEAIPALCAAKIYLALSIAGDL